MKNKKKLGIIIGICAVLLAAVAVFVIVKMNGNKNNDNVFKSEITDSTIVGQIDNDTYNNDYFGLHIALPSDKWSFSSNDDILKQFPALAIDKNTNLPFVNNGAEASYYACVAKDQETSESIIVQVLDETSFSSNDGFNTEYLANSLVTQTEESYKKQNYEIVSKNANYKQEKVGDCDYQYATIITNNGSVEIKQGIIVCVKGNYAICATVTSNDIVDNFDSFIESTK